MSEELPLVKPGFRFGLRAMFFVITVVAILFGLVAPAVMAAREAARRMTSQSNARQLVMAMHNYHDAYACLPHARICHPTGTPMHSWRVTLVPYLESSSFYTRYDQKQAWNSPVNGTLGRQYAFGEHVYNRPGNTKLNKHCTSFVTVTGTGTPFPDDCFLSFDDIAAGDGAAVTIMLAEIDHSDILWYEPRDFPLQEVSMRLSVRQSGKLCLGSRQPQGVIAGFADGSARLISQDIAPEVLHAYFTINGGEQVAPPE